MGKIKELSQKLQISEWLFYLVFCAILAAPLCWLLGVPFWRGFLKMVITP